MRERNKLTDTAHQIEPTRADSQSAGARRRLLKHLLAGSGVIAASALVPQKWTAPVVQSVLLPAHAAGSPGGTPGPECSEQLAEVTCPPGTVGTITRYLNAANPYTCGAGGELVLLQSMTCDGATQDNTVGNSDRIGFMITGVGGEIISATAGFQEVGQDPLLDSIQSSKCVDNNGGTLDWDTSIGRHISAAVGSAPNCLQLVVRFYCDEDCGGGAGAACILGYTMTNSGTPEGCE